MVDENMPYAKVLFECFGDVQTVTGRAIPMSELLLSDALMVRSVTQVNSALLNGSRVKFVGTATAGTDHIDKNWLAQAGINFAAAPGCNAIAVTEYVFSTLLTLTQQLKNFVLSDKTIGIIGAGNIGSCLQQRLNAFSIRTMLCDPPLAEIGTPGDWYSLEALVAEADVLTFHVPLTCSGRHATWHQVDKELLAALPNERVIINTCRGAVVDNYALLQALEGGKSLTVVLDVWETEPALLLPLLARVDIGTAHIAGYTLEGKIRGTVQIFNAYSAHVGSNKRANLAVLLPPPIVDHIRLRGKINEEALCLLAHLVYDVRRDDMQLRRMAGLIGGFDYLRKNYYQRREWSSLCVETDDSVSANLLKQIGFQARPFFS